MTDRSSKRQMQAQRVTIAWLMVSCLFLSIVLVAFRFRVVPTRDDMWITDQSTNRLCTLGFEAIYSPCSSGLALALSQLRLVHPNGVNWWASIYSLRGADVRMATGACYDAKVWYADNAGNLFLSDNHAYAVDAPLPLPFREGVRVCAFLGRRGVFAIDDGTIKAPAARMR